MNDIVVYQIDCKVYLLRSIKLDHILSEISSFVDAALASDEKMLEFHRSYGYKNYVLSGFKELELDKCYKEGRIYTFSVRCVKEELCDFFAQNLADTKIVTMKGLVTTVKTIPELFLEKLYTVTPSLIKLDGVGYWRGSLSFQEYEKRLFDNCIKKYKHLTGKEIDENFSLYSRIQMLNNKPIANYFKGVRLLGDKFELHIAENEDAQNIAYMLLGTGVCENNSRGYGFLNYTAIR
ncbi:MAG TPA: CRISPR-associated endoribonuclease Cas6 [Clostridiales bacterium]|nr:CRISPR-associated endoribonuclease Cas6 [Clostridiales bacterium]